MQLMRRIRITHHLSPGDTLALTAAVNCLARQFPDDFEIAVSTTAQDIWQGNPHVKNLKPEECEIVKADYNTIHHWPQLPTHFIEAFVHDLAFKLDIELHCDVNRPFLYLSDAEKIRPKTFAGYDLAKPFALVNAGVKNDYTAKGAGSQIYQEIVDHFADRFDFIQIGMTGHQHKPLDNVKNLIDKTSNRELIRLAQHSAFGVGPVSFLHHIYAALQKPYVCYLGGREPLGWVQYPTAVCLNMLGCLPCCSDRACWRSRVTPLADNSHLNNSLCELPVLQSNGELVPMCMALLGSEPAIKAIETMLGTGVIKP
jgi:ADP-heptose:LPS heptosyltransferase